MNAGIEIRPATVADAAALAEIGARIFKDTFGPDNTAEDMAAYLAKSFSEKLQRAEIEDKARRIFLAWHGQEVAGYAQLWMESFDPAVQGPKPIRLNRLHVDKSWHGKGIAQALMQTCLDTSVKLGFETIWLGVWERNARAIAFYHKFDFQKVGEQTFVLGEDVQQDWVMARSLS